MWREREREREREIERERERDRENRSKWIYVLVRGREGRGPSVCRITIPRRVRVLRLRQTAKVTGGAIKCRHERARAGNCLIS